ncbi:predicted protein [Nematostella vectensis]|uniref:Dynein regulatory complex protein 9 n=1 Tax=Nematostella vectensis TaxID=45351 RepID=A7S8J5_NEMVE|nr:predicted protein [Nematostella vectensis]|eukprot:XP_001632061.1 predicted protein [Nematostella vectensis]
MYVSQEHGTKVSVARTEEENAHKRKLNKQTTPIKITPSPLGGGQSSEQDAKLRLQRENERKTRQKALEVKKKREEYRKKEKEREDEEITKKKALAREQLQSWWRGVMVRRQLGPYSKKKKKKGKKGKKSGKKGKKGKKK